MTPNAPDRRLRGLARSALLGSVPGRYRLASQMLIDRLLGRLEEELDILGSVTTARGTAVDVGANRGYYSYVMSGIFSQVVTFEPNAALTSDLARSDARNITIHHCALSSADNTLRLHIPRRDGRSFDGWASIDTAQLSGWDSVDIVEVPGRRLDGFALQDVGLVKIDVEGHELDVLDGAARTLSVNRPVVVIEVKLVNRAAVGEFLQSLDLMPHVMSGGRLCQLAQGIQRYGGPKDTFVFVPAEPARERVGAAASAKRPCG